MSLHRRLPALLGVLLLPASPAMAQYDATAIPPPPTLAQPVVVLAIFVGIFVAAAWSLTTLMGRPVRLSIKPRRRYRSRF